MAASLEASVLWGVDRGELSDEELEDQVRRWTPTGLGAPTARAWQAATARVIRREVVAAVEAVQQWRLVSSDTTVSPSPSEQAAMEYVYAVALLLAFAQHNWTGPPVHLEEQAFSDSTIPLLQVDGEELWAAPGTASWLALSQQLLWEQMDAAPSAYHIWWYGRAVWAHQQCLSGPSPVLQQRLQQVYGHLLREQVPDIAASADDSTLAALSDRTPLQDPRERRLAGVEWSLIQHYYYQAERAVASLEAAQRLSAVRVEVTGAWGVRLRHQQRQTALMVARSEDPPSANGASGDGQMERHPVADESLLPRDVPLHDPDVIGRNVVATAGAAVASSTLRTEDALLVLARCALARSYGAETRLTGEQLAALVQLVLDAARQSDARATTDTLLRAYALLLRCRLEADKGRYQERTLHQMEELCEHWYAAAAANPHPVYRLRYLWAVAYPPRWQLHREYAAVLGRLGLVKSALQVYQQWDLWDEVIDCHRLMGNMPRAERLVLERLQQCGRTPRLLCVLADVRAFLPGRSANAAEDTDPVSALYAEAWRVSDERYARAQRSLARWAMRHGRHADAVRHWQLALALNPLYPDGWMALGYSAQQLGQWDTAAAAYTRVVQCEPDHAEAWSNLGGVLMQRARSTVEDKAAESTTPADTVDADHQRALECFQQACRWRPDMWRLQYHTLVAANVVGAPAAAISALRRLLAIRNGPGWTTVTDDGMQLTRLVQWLERRNAEAVDDVQQRWARHLVAVLQETAVPAGVSEPLLWDALARLHALLGERLAVLRYRQRQLRCVLHRYECKHGRRGAGVSSAEHGAVCGVALLAARSARDVEGEEEEVSPLRRGLLRQLQSVRRQCAGQDEAGESCGQLAALMAE